MSIVTDNQCLQLLLETHQDGKLLRYSVVPNIVTFDSFNVSEHLQEGGSRIVNEQWHKTPAEAVRAAVRKVKADTSPKCSVCGKTEGVSWIGGYQPYLCKNPECVPY